MWDMSQQPSCLAACTTTNQPIPANAAYSSWTDITGTQHSISGGATPIGYQPILIE
jgi:hypothetical protein